MKKLEKIDLFKKFEKDEITDLQNLKGGGTCQGQMVDEHTWCAYDSGDPKTGYIYAWWGCEEV